MHRFLILVVAGMTASTAAFADDEGSLRGSYAFTGASSCIQDSASFGFNPDFTVLASGSARVLPGVLVRDDSGE
jgi:hypothetical protein